jgi:hypothetical protein
VPSYKVAHVREQGQDMIIVPLDSSFGREPSTQQHRFIDDLQRRATSAGLRGRVVAVWNGGFIAPRPWHPFVRSLSSSAVHANLNQELSW